MSRKRYGQYFAKKITLHMKLRHAGKQPFNTIEVPAYEIHGDGGSTGYCITRHRRWGYTGVGRYSVETADWTIYEVARGVRASSAAYQLYGRALWALAQTLAVPDLCKALKVCADSAEKHWFIESLGE